MRTFNSISALTSLVALLAAVHSPVSVPQLDAQSTGEDIMRESDRVHRGFIGERAALTMILINAQGEQTERRFTFELRERENDGNQSRIDFDSPENVRGTILLTHAHDAADDDQWLYLPSTRRVRRIAGANRSGAFMGSEFTYEDLAPPVLAKYTYARFPDAAVEGKACYQVERRPKTEGSGYSRQMVWLDKAHLSPVMVEYYDRRNELLKVAFYRGPRMFGAYERHDLLRMENRQTRRVSELRAGIRQLGIKLDDLRFRSQALGQ